MGRSTSGDKKIKGYYVWKRLPNTEFSETDAIGKCQQLAQKNAGLYPQYLNPHFCFYNRHGVVTVISEDYKRHFFYGHPADQEMNEMLEEDNHLNFYRSGAIFVSSNDNSFSFMLYEDEKAYLNNEKAKRIILCPELKLKIEKYEAEQETSNTPKTL